MSVTAERPRFEHESERIVWEVLEKQVAPGTVLIPNMRLTSALKDHELDVVAMMPGVGIIVIEVKGGSVWVDQDGRWWSGNSKRKSVVRPVDQ